MTPQPTPPTEGDLWVLRRIFIPALLCWFWGKR